MRVRNLESTWNTFAVSLNNVATKRELRNLVAVIDSQITSLEDTIGQRNAAGALVVPRMTTVERDALSPISGMQVFNRTTSTFQGYDGTTWQELG